VPFISSNYIIKISQGTAISISTLSLPVDVIEADTVNTFKNRLDEYWSNQDVFFNFNADLIATGSLPVRV